MMSTGLQVVEGSPFDKKKQPLLDQTRNSRLSRDSRQSIGDQQRAANMSRIIHKIASRSNSKDSNTSTTFAQNAIRMIDQKSDIRSFGDSRERPQTLRETSQQIKNLNNATDRLVGLNNSPVLFENMRPSRQRPADRLHSIQMPDSRNSPEPPK